MLLVGRVARACRTCACASTSEKNIYRWIKQNVHIKTKHRCSKSNRAALPRWCNSTTKSFTKFHQTTYTKKPITVKKCTQLHSSIKPITDKKCTNSTKKYEHHLIAGDEEEGTQKAKSRLSLAKSLSIFLFSYPFSQDSFSIFAYAPKD